MNDVSPDEPRQERVRSRSKLWIGGSVAATALALLLVWTAFGGIESGLLTLFAVVEEEAEEASPVEPVLEVTEDLQEVLLFFARADGQQLGVERTSIFDLDSPVARGKLILERLAEGPERDDLSPVLPEETLLRKFWIAGDGTAYVDFSRQLGRDHMGGTTAEIHTVYAIVNSLAYNLAEVHRVQILIEGREVDTLSGHVALWMPLTANYGLVPSSETSPVVTSQVVQP